MLTGEAARTARCWTVRGPQVEEVVAEPVIPPEFTTNGEAVISVAKINDCLGLLGESRR